MSDYVIVKDFSDADTNDDVVLGVDLDVEFSAIQTAVNTKYDQTDDNDIRFPVNTVAIFSQAAAPAGWVQVTSQNNKLLLISNGAGGTSTATSWTLTGITGDVHTLTTAETPAHTHNLTQSAVARTGGPSGAFIQAGAGVTGSTGGAGSHAADLVIDGLWRPNLTEAIQCKTTG